MSNTNRYRTKVFGERLRQIRELIGLSQSEFAEKLGVSRGSISFYENGERTPDIEFLDTIKMFSGIATDYLLGYSNNIKDENIGIGQKLELSDKAIDIWQNQLKKSEKILLSELIENEKFSNLINHMCSYTYGCAPFLKAALPYQKERELYDGYRVFLITKLVIEVLNDIKDEEKSRNMRCDFEGLISEQRKLIEEDLTLESEALKEYEALLEKRWHEMDSGYSDEIRLKIRAAFLLNDDTISGGDPDGSDKKEE